MTDNKTTADMQAELEDLRAFVLSFANCPSIDLPYDSIGYVTHHAKANELVTQFNITADDKADDDES